MRAQIQLLKKYALGNHAPLATPDVAPSAGASATTWGGLAGTWATAATYWTALSTVSESMLSHAGTASDELPLLSAFVTASCPAGELAIAGDYALPFQRRWYDEHPEWFTRPDHDYPAIDIPVPVGTPLFAMTNGVVVGTPTGGRCVIGVVLNGDDGAQYTYCHGQRGTQAVAIGDRITVGQYLLDSASTGTSTGPHLHFGIDTGGASVALRPSSSPSPKVSASHPRGSQRPAASADLRSIHGRVPRRLLPRGQRHRAGACLPRRPRR